MNTTRKNHRTSREDGLDEADQEFEEMVEVVRRWSRRRAVRRPPRDSSEDLPSVRPDDASLH